MSPQNQKLLDVLLDGEWHRTDEIAQRTRIGYPPRRIHELRKEHGLQIESRKTKQGWDEYRLVPLRERSLTFRQLESLKAPEPPKEPTQPRLL